MLKPKSPHRLCSTWPNDILGQNQLLGVLPDDLQDHFGDIHHDDDLLRRAYVPRRYPAVTRYGMNYEDPGQFVDNAVSTYDGKRGQWVRAPLPPELNDLREQIGKHVEDRAEVHLVLELLRLARHISRGTAGAAERMLFLQAGIGSGKSTLLSHVRGVVAPELNRLHLASIDLIPVMADLNNYDGDEDVDGLWSKALAELQAQLVAVTGIDSTEGWYQIARPEIFDGKGRLRPALDTAPDRKRAILSVVNQSADPLVFIRRVARTLFERPRPAVVVLLLDNLDRQSDVSKQMKLISRFHSLLGQTRLPLGAAAVREHSLGNLGHIESFQAFFHVNRMHITTPFIGEVVGKRFEICLRELRRADRMLRTIRIRDNVVVGPVHLEEIFQSVASAFGTDHGDADVTRSQETRAMTDRDRPMHVAELLNQITNSNGRASLSLVLEAMRSWALQQEGIIVEYLFQRDQQARRGPDGRERRRDGKVRLPSFTVDELLRLAFVGEHRYYDHEKSPHIFNLFSRGAEKPQANAGRFPALFTYRIFQHFDVVGGRSTLAEVQSRLRCFGYHALEIEDTLTDLMRGGFLESPEGNHLEKAKAIFSTRKLDFYLHKFSKMLVYLENVRNDTVIEYESQPHQARSTLCDDIYEVLKFIAYIAEQEAAEYQFVKSARPGFLGEYQAIATVQPVSWKLLKSVCKRSNLLHAARRDLFSRKGDVSAAETAALFVRLRDSIVERGDQNLIWPRVPQADRGRVFLTWGHDDPRRVVA